jgi:hypothetical protein
LSSEFVYHLTETLPLPLLAVPVIVICGVWMIIVANFLVIMSLICLYELLSRRGCRRRRRRRFNLGLGHRHQHCAAFERRVPAPHLSSSLPTTDPTVAAPPGQDVFLPSKLLISNAFARPHCAGLRR